MDAYEAGMTSAHARVADWPRKGGWVRDVLRDLASVEVSVADGYAARVAAAVRTEPGGAVSLAGERALRAGRRSAEAVADWARRDRRTAGAIASSALIVGALAIGFEARHVRRARRAGVQAERAA